ncbi:SPOR domain-containing protein [Phaeobacter sp. PT47_59]|uniref:SPOR domain-containing protein n=1 Tax=Phaeobacter sp. PT47_59 TaxID=3029979 RepID=UPI0023800A4C|nr:SPOR domain-containing protein [Phaeobacter sp. PT47_59]MDE4175155.1 SPOR domain-containing protein [Phaeobacter sp. PT47_59]
MAYFTQAGARPAYDHGGVAQADPAGGAQYQQQHFAAPEPPIAAPARQPFGQPQPAYAAPEAPHAYGGFDPAQAGAYGEDDYGYDGIDEDAAAGQGGFGRIAGILGGIASLALVVGIGVWGYKLVMRDVSGVPVVRAVEGPMRIQPENPGGRQADHQGLAVNAVAATGVAEDPADRLVLAPEPIELTEDDRPMSELAQLAEQDRADQAGPSGSAVSEETLAAYQGGDINALVAELTEGVAPLGSAPEVGSAPAERVETALSAPAIIQPEPLKPVEIAAIAAAPQPSAALLKAPGVKISLRPHLRPARFAPATAPAATASGSVALEVSADSLPAGTRLAQLGAYESAEVARAEWDRIYGQFEDYLADKKRVIQRAESGGRTFYRLRAMGFDGLSDARRFCSALVAGNADCIPVTTR